MSFCKTCGHGLTPEQSTTRTRKQRRALAKQKANKLAQQALRHLDRDDVEKDHKDDS